MKITLPKVAAVIIFFVSISLQAQYKITTSSQTYQTLQAATPITGSKYIDTLVVGAKFLNSDTLLLSRVAGFVQVPSKPESTFYFYGAEMIGGQWSYKIDTVGGIKVLKIEAKNAGFGHDFSQQDYINVQLWLFADQTTEVHFGLRKITNPDFDFYFGMGGPSIGYKGAKLTGSTTAPTLSTSDTARITGSPVSGTVYKFTPANLSVKEITTSGINLYPNPANTTFEITLENPVKSVVVTDATGRVLQSFETNKEHSIAIETTFWPTGIYIIRAETTEGFVSKVLVKQ